MAVCSPSVYSMDTSGEASQLSVALAVAMPVLSVERSAWQSAPATTVAAGGQVIDGAGFSSSNKFMICVKDALFSHSSVAVMVTE